MKLPNVENAVVPRAKIVDYLLSSTHRDGRSKAEFFTRFGFSADAWEILANALLRHAADNEVSRIEESRFGTRFVIDGIIDSPGNRKPRIRSVWFVENEEEFPRFVSAYPLKERMQ